MVCASVGTGLAVASVVDRSSGRSIVVHKAVILKYRYITYIVRTRSSCVHNITLSPASCPGRVDLLAHPLVAKIFVFSHFIRCFIHSEL